MKLLFRQRMVRKIASSPRRRRSSIIKNLGWIPHQACLTSFLALLAFLLISFTLLACSDSGGGKPADEDSDQAEAISNPCDEPGKLGCLDETLAAQCEGGAWNVLADCADVGKICYEGRCIFAEDGDLELSEETEDDLEPQESNDTEAPYITSTNPIDGQENTPLPVQIVEINFNETLNTEGFVVGRDVSFTGGGMNIIVSGEFQNNTRQLELNLVTHLEEGTTYTVEIAADKLSDLAGNRFGGGGLTFTTEGMADGDRELDEGDQSPPEIDYTIPADGATGVNVSLNEIQISFNEYVRHPSFDAAEAIELLGEDGHEPAFETTWHLPHQTDETSHKLLSIAINNRFHDDTRYTVTLHEGAIEDREGNPMQQASFSFSTGDEISDTSDGDLDETIEGYDLEPEWGYDLEPEEAEAIVPNTGIIRRTVSGDCNEGIIPDEPEIFALYNADEEMLTVTLENAEFDRCGEIAGDMQQDGGTLTLFAFVPFGQCYETCPRNIAFDIINLHPATYDVTVYPCPMGEACAGFQTSVEVSQNR